jgi:hypothetical protein
MFPDFYPECGDIYHANTLDRVSKGQSLSETDAHRSDRFPPYPVIAPRGGCCRPHRGKTTYHHPTQTPLMFSPEQVSARSRPFMTLYDFTINQQIYYFMCHRRDVQMNSPDRLRRALNDMYGHRKDTENAHCLCCSVSLSLGRKLCLKCYVRTDDTFLSAG